MRLRTPSPFLIPSPGLSDAELEAILARAAQEGARRALHDVGLGDQDAVLTIHDMRSLLVWMPLGLQGDSERVGL